MLRSSWCVLAVAFLGGVAWACDVPVYRYALEQWEADPFEAIVFHRGPLGEADEECVDTLLGGRMEGANLLVNTVDLAGEVPPAMSALWESQGDAKPPWLVLRFSHLVAGQPPAWSGPLDMTACERAIHSPVRRELAGHLIDGVAGVFLFLDSGDAARDDAAAARLEAALNKAEEHLELPTGTTDAAPQMDDALLDELDVQFTMVRFSREDAEEQALVSTLMGLEPGLRDLEGPMAFPVFGRGRALYALVGQGINEDTVTEACSFIVGSCTCQVKDLNPGTDLLLAANWDDELDTLLSVETLVEVLPRPSEMVAAAAAPSEEDIEEPQSSTVPASVEADKPAPPAGGGVLLNVGLAILGGLIVVVAASLVLVKRTQGAM